MKNIIEKLLTKTLCYPVKHVHFNRGHHEEVTSQATMIFLSVHGLKTGPKCSSEKFLSVVYSFV